MASKDLDPHGTIPRVIASAIMRYRNVLLLLTLLSVAFAAAQFPRLQANFSPQTLFATVDEEQRATEAFKEEFGNTESVMLLLVQAPDVLEPEVLQFIHDASLHFAEQDWALRVESPTVTVLPRGGGTGTIDVSPVVVGDTVEESEARELRETLELNDAFRGSLLNDDGTLASIAILMENDHVDITSIRRALGEAEDWLAENPPPAGVSAEFGGIPQVRAYVVNQMFSDQLTLVPFSLLVTIFLLWICFRWLPAMLVPNVAVLISIALVTGGMALVGEPFNMVNQMLPILILVIGINDSIHLVNRYGEELRVPGQGRKLASEATIRTMLVACFLTSFTTAVGFGTLAVARTEILRRFGIAAALAMLVAYVVTVAVVPSLLLWFKAPTSQGFVSHDGWLERQLDGLTRRVLAVPRTLLVIMLVTVSLSVWQASTVIIDSTLMELFRRGDPTMESIHMIEDELNGVIPVELSFRADEENRFYDHELLNAIDELAAWIDEQPGVLQTTTWSDLLHQSWVAYTSDPEKRHAPFRSRAQVAQLSSLLEGGTDDPTARWITFDRRHLRLNIQTRDMGGVWTLELAEEMQREIDERLGDFDDLRVTITGDGYSAARGVDFIMRDMLASVGLAFIIIFIFMSFLFRSVRLGLLSVPPNMIPLLLSLAWMGMRGIYLNSTTAIIFSVSLGLAVDDTIHYLARFREEERRGVGRDAAIIAAARGTGRAIIVSSIMLVGGMAVLLGSSFMPIRLFAELIAVTVVGCLIGDLVLLPALLKVAWPDEGAESEDTDAS